MITFQFPMGQATSRYLVHGAPMWSVPLQLYVPVFLLLHQHPVVAELPQASKPIPAFPGAEGYTGIEEYAHECAAQRMKLQPLVNQVDILESRDQTSRADRADSPDRALPAETVSATMQSLAGHNKPKEPFSIRRHNGVDWLVKPDGTRFFSVGVCCVDQGIPREKNTLYRRHGASCVFVWPKPLPFE
jgi:hypothetical protein